MLQLHLPVNAGDVSRPVKDQHLMPCFPRGSWDGWFAIAVFPPGGSICWIKAHYYHCACRRGHTPLAAVEGFRDRSEMLIAWAGPDKVETLQRDLPGGVPESSLGPLRVERQGRFRLQGTAPRYSMDFSLPEAGARFDFETAWPIWWSRWGRLLTYAGQHAAVRSRLSGRGPEEEMTGLGVMEHVSGASLPFDFTRALPIHYHWDVLAFHTPGSPADSAAGLSIGRGGRTRLELRAAARLPGRGVESMQGLSVRYLETSVLEDGRGTGVMIPARWEGVLHSPGGVFRYEAAAATPLAGILPGGGMLGFDFSGTWKAAGGGTGRWEGTGFCEYGDFSGGLIRAFSSGRPEPCGQGAFCRLW